MLRLNTGIPPASRPHRLGVLAGDVAGFPNGRRVGDDVVDIALQAMAGCDAADAGLRPGAEQPPRRRRGAERQGVPLDVPVPDRAASRARQQRGAATSQCQVAMEPPCDAAMTRCSSPCPCGDSSPSVRGDWCGLARRGAEAAARRSRCRWCRARSPSRSRATLRIADARLAADPADAPAAVRAAEILLRKARVERNGGHAIEAEQVLEDAARAGALRSIPR